MPKPRNIVNFSALLLLGCVLVVAAGGGAYLLVAKERVIAFSEFPANAIKPEARKGITPRPCVAFNPPSNQSAAPLWGQTYGECAKHHVFVANTNFTSKFKDGPPENVPLHGLCCPLPAEDILTNDHTYSVIESCPEQYVATGGTGKCEDSCMMRCTRINTERYKLGPEQMSIYLKGMREGITHGAGSARKLYWDQLPSVIRAGALRLDHRSWQRDGCIGAPLGALLTRKSGTQCDGFFYRELLYRDGTPVAIFPDCAAISDPYDPNPRCLSESESEKAVTLMANFE